MKWHAAGRQIVGARSYQEDRWAIMPWRDGLVAVVADGMGGHQGGAVASDLAISAFTRELERPGAGDADSMPQALQRGIAAATEAIKLRVVHEPGLSDMGCTLVCAVLQGMRLHWISVGDSPLWLIDAGQLHRLNADHSMRPILDEMVQTGRLSRQEADRHPSRNALRSVVSREPPSLTDQGERLLSSRGDHRILLASDGIETLSSGDIAGMTASARTPEDATSALLAKVELAKSVSQDNTTVIVAAPATA